MKKNFTALLILDGYGLTDSTKGNAILGNSPYIDGLRSRFPCARLSCSGESVGLPAGQMGNSEVGHVNIGAGRVVFQELPRINNAIVDGSFFANPVLEKVCEEVRAQKGDIHLIGLLSDGGVHSSFEHLTALVKFFKMHAFPQVYVHCFLDGRDVAPKSALTYLKKLDSFLKQENYGKIATICGRYYAMDRDNRWDRVQKAYDMLALGEGLRYQNFESAIEESYEKGVTDEFVLPIVLQSGEKPVATIKDGDGVVFFNFRNDRTRELTRAFTQDGFDGFDLAGKKRKLSWVCMTEYDKNFKNVEVAFAPHKPQNTLGEYLSTLGKKQLRIAETEKYAHVTFFFNGGREEPFAGEERVLISSPKVATYDLKPEMSAYEVTDKAIELLEEKDFDVMILNYANCDMVGHTGVFEAAQQAVKAVDACVQKLVEFITARGGRVFITADHGNAEKLLEEDGGVHSAHTTNDVFFICVSPYDDGCELKKEGGLCDIAPTLLESMGLSIPNEMTGKSLFETK